MIIIISISGCSSCDTSSHKTEDKIEIKQENGIPIHGNFCGPNIPTINSTTVNLQVNELEKIVPIDVVDSACKDHDICYVKKGYFNYECDKALIDAIDSLLKYKDSDISCAAMNVAIIDYFKLSNPGNTPIGSYADTIITAGLLQGSNLWMSTGVKFYKAETSATIIIFSPIILLFTNTKSCQIYDLLKTIHTTESGYFDYYPSRFRVCEFKNKEKEKQNGSK